MQVEIGEKTLVYCAPVNEKTGQWGVYAIPRMWREPNGKLYVLVNGETDSPILNAPDCPDLLFVSGDNGKTWREEKKFNLKEIKRLCGIDPPFCQLSDGRTVCIREKVGLTHVRDAEPKKRFSVFDGGEEVVTYRQGDLPKDAFGCERCVYDESGKLISIDDVSIDFAEREIIVYDKIFANGALKEQKSYVRSTIVASPYINSVTEMQDGTLAGTCFGQNPEVSDRFCGETYFMTSKDGGKTWTKRTKITCNSEEYPFGLTGDGGESSLALSPDGTLYCLTRTDMSIDHTVKGGKSDAMLFVSKDKGYTWSKGWTVADSSVTPHVLAFKGGVVVIVYGRPGVHIKVSTDGGKTFGKPLSIIGKTLTEELSSGKSYMDAKYFDMDSYSNTFIEKLSENSFLILYTDMKYDPGDGLRHKAGFVRKITINQ